MSTEHGCVSTLALLLTLVVRVLNASLATVVLVIILVT